MTKIAVLDDYQGVATSYGDWSQLPADATVTVFHDHIADPHRVIDRLKPFDVVCLMRERTPLTRQIIEALPNLKFVCTTGARNASVDMEALKDRGIPMSGTRGSGNPTAELAWGLILGLLRHIPFEHAAMQRGAWQTTIGRGVAGKTLGLLGLGNLGSDVAKVGKAFGCELIAWSQNLTEEKAAAQGARLVSKEDLFRQADIVSISLVLSARSRGLVGAAELALMKPTALLINTSRGPIVDEQALLTALREKRIAGAGLDTYDIEPLPRSHPFRDLDNVVLTPHLGYVTEETYRLFYPQTIENIAGWLKGAPVRVVG